MDLDCITCMETCLSGLQIGMDVRIRTVVRGVIRVLTVCFVVVSGTTTRTASGRRTGTETARRAGPPPTVFDFARSLIPRLYSTQELIMPKKQEFPLNPEIFFGRFPSLFRFSKLSLKKERIQPRAKRDVGHRSEPRSAKRTKEQSDEQYQSSS